MSSETSVPRLSLDIPCLYCAGYDVRDHNDNCTNKKQYEEIKVNDEEIKYKKLCESQERFIASLEHEIVRLTDLLGGQYTKPPVILDSGMDSPTSTTLPQGVILKSKFRETVEEQLRQKAIQKQEENK